MNIIVVGLSSNDMFGRTFELFYETGGHVGPFPDLLSAIDGAFHRLNDTDTYLDAVDRQTGKVVARIQFNGNNDLVVSPKNVSWKTFVVSVEEEVTKKRLVPVL